MKTFKKIISMVLSVVMVFSMLPDVSGFATQEDITPPVVSNVNFSINGHSVLVEFDAYDTDGSPLDASLTKIAAPQLSTPNNELRAFAINMNNSRYTAEFIVDNGFEGALDIEYLYISDVHGNSYVMSNTDGSPIFSGFIQSAATGTITVKDVCFNGQTNAVITLTDSSPLPTNMTITANVDTNANIPDGAQFEIGFISHEANTGSTSHSNIMLTYSAATKTISGSLGLTFFFFSTPYNVDYVKYSGTPVTYSGTSTFTVDKQNTDKTPPKVYDIYFTVDGVKTDPGFILEYNTATARYPDVQLHYKTTEAPEHDEIVLRTNLENLSNDFVGLPNINYVNGEYVTDIPVDTMYATEWYIWDMIIVDKYFNHNDEMHEEYYFFIKDTDGNISLPYKEQKFTFNYNGNWDDMVKFTTNVPRVTTLREILNLAGVTVTPLDFDGRTFKGWHCGALEKAYDLDDTIFIPDWCDELWFNPVYDKAPVNTHLWYVDEQGNMEAESTVISVDYGSTVADLITEANKLNLPHMATLEFQKWVPDSPNVVLTNTIDPGFFGIGLKAE